MVAMLASMRTVLVIFPSRNGTFKSWRISTRLPDKSWSCMSFTVIGDSVIEMRCGETKKPERAGADTGAFRFFGRHRCDLQQLLRGFNDIFDREAEVLHQVLTFCGLTKSGHAHNLAVQTDVFVPRVHMGRFHRHTSADGGRQHRLAVLGIMRKIGRAHVRTPVTCPPHILYPS